MHPNRNAIDAAQKCDNFLALLCLEPFLWYGLVSPCFAANDFKLSLYLAKLATKLVVITLKLKSRDTD